MIDPKGNRSIPDDEIDEASEEQSELYEHFRFDVDKGQEMLRIDKYLTSF
jgi:23S rRNA pseudouridine1911/1915/1917 synthase